MTAAENKSHYELTTDMPDLALTGELWGVYFKNYGEKWHLIPFWQRMSALSIYLVITAIVWIFYWLRIYNLT